MGRKIAFLLLIVLSLLVPSLAWNLNQLRHYITPNQAEFTGIFLLRWPAAYCQHLHIDRQVTCLPQRLALWDSLSFTVGGLWLSSRTPRQYRDFNWYEIDQNKGLLDRLLNYWPDLYRLQGGETANPQFGMWEYEWNTYGKDYAHLLDTLYSEELDPVRPNYQSIYFDDILKLYQRRFYDAKKIFKSSILHPEEAFILRRDELANLLRLKEGQFVLKCLPGGNRVFQIQVCLKFDEDEGVEVDCSEVEKESTFRLEDSCSGEVQLLDYNLNRDTPSGRVTSYAPQDL